MYSIHPLNKFTYYQHYVGHVHVHIGNILHYLTLLYTGPPTPYDDDDDDDDDK